MKDERWRWYSLVFLALWAISVAVSLGSRLPADEVKHIVCGEN
jgi:hypothetical protein